jgi:hypothetical protein
MEKDRQDGAQKRWAVVRIRDPFREAKRARGGAKSVAPGSSKLAPAAKRAAPSVGKLVPAAKPGVKAAASGAGKPPSGEPAKGRKVPSPARAGEEGARMSDFDTDISVSDYLGGKFFLTRDDGAGSDMGQLPLVPTPVVAPSSSAAEGAKGVLRDPWSTFCASSEISSAAVAKDVAGSMSQQLRRASQQLQHVSRVGPR